MQIVASHPTSSRHPVAKLLQSAPALNRHFGMVLGGLLGLTLMGTAASAQVVDAQGIGTTLAQAPLAGDGVYFYGQAPEVDQVGAGYMVFEAHGDRVVGAIYFPYSSFDCFHGQINQRELALQVTNSYTQETYPFEIALVPTTPIANRDGAVATSMTLEDLYNLGAARDAEQAILQTCKAFMAESGVEL